MPTPVFRLRARAADVTAALASADGVLLTAPDPATIFASLTGAPAVLNAIQGAWLGGAALLANDAAASALGTAFTSDPRPGDTIGQIESAASANRHWGRLYNLVASQAADRLAYGIDAGTAVEFRPDLAAPRVVGDGAAVALDGRSGSFGVGSNGALAARWVILDTFVGGQEIAP